MVLRFILMISLFASAFDVLCKKSFYSPKKYAHLQQKKLGRLGKNRSKISKKYTKKSNKCQSSGSCPDVINEPLFAVLANSQLPAYRTDTELQWPDRYGYNPMGSALDN